ncbi:Hypothetical predicted protein, partial [Podarcis lilfordi]
PFKEMHKMNILDWYTDYLAKCAKRNSSFRVTDLGHSPPIQSAMLVCLTHSSSPTLAGRQAAANQSHTLNPVDTAQSGGQVKSAPVTDCSSSNSSESGTVLVMHIGPDALLGPRNPAVLWSSLNITEQKQFTYSLPLKSASLKLKTHSLPLVTISCALDTKDVAISCNTVPLKAMEWDSAILTSVTLISMDLIMTNLDLNSIDVQGYGTHLEVNGSNLELFKV